MYLQMKQYQLIVFLLLTTLQFISQVKGSSSCTVDFIPRNSILNALTSGGGPQGAMGMKKKKNEMLTQARHEQQSIFTNQHFNCTGMLTEWIFAGRWNDRNEGFPQLQIWRLTESSSNTYTNIANSTVVVPTKLASQIYSYIPDPPLNVLNGDVVGIHQPEGRKSKLTIYFYHSANLFYYKDKIKEPLHQLSINDNNILTADSLPMISVVIEPLSATSSTTNTVSFSTTSVIVTKTTQNSIVSSTTTTTTIPNSTPISFSSQSNIKTMTPTHSLKPTTTSTLVSPQVTMTTIDHQDTTNTITTTRSTEKPLLHTTIVETSSQSISDTFSITSNSAIHSQMNTLSINSPAPTSAIESFSSSDRKVSLQPNTTSEVSNDDSESSGIDSFLVVIIGVLFGVTTGMMCITIGALCIVVVLVKRKKKESVSKQSGLISYPFGSRPNRYIQKSVSSPMYEGGLPLVELCSLAPQSVITQETAENNSLQSTSSTSSSCPSVTVHPTEVVVTVHPTSLYDRLSEKHVKNHNLISPVSPYERPVLSEEASPTNKDLYDFADAIYVPTETQRQIIETDERNKEYDETLYKTLYEAQHTNDNEHKNDSQCFFNETSEYWKPSCTTNAIYKQLASKRYREVPRHKIQVIEYLGSGQFATVNKALWRTGGYDVEVAVKMIKTGASEVEKIKFLQEAAVNGQFHHINIVRLLGVVTVGEPAMIILELLKNGNLKKFLGSRRPPRGEKVPTELPNMLLNFCKQVAAGMEYLAKKTFIHRDIAARNILVSDQLICKVADFGMSRDLEENNYYVSQGGLIPIKWTAPEALYYRKYSTASDVWSYGVLMFEIWSMGKKPFSSISNEQYIEQIDEGVRLHPPPGCPRRMYQLMIECWHPESSDRPSFTDVLHYFASSKEDLLAFGVTNDELAESPNSIVLCGPFDAGQSIFKDLQMKYRED